MRVYVNINFNTDNAAFESNPDELTRVIKKGADKAVQLITTGAVEPDDDLCTVTLSDINGNKVGYVQVSLEEDE